MKWIIRIYSFVLLAYTAWRTVDFLLSQLPKNDVSLWLSLAFLFASEAGLLLWHEVSLNHTTTREQHYISTGLTWVDFIGSLAAGTADMILRQTMIDGYAIPMWLAQALIYGLPATMAANVAAVLLYLSNDAEVQLDRAKKHLKFEIYEQAMKELGENRGAIAESMKKDIFRELRDDVTGKVAKQFMREPSVIIPAPTANGNGKIVMAHESTVIPEIEERKANPTNRQP